MFVTNWISPTKIQKISEITNFFRHYFLSRTEVNNYAVAMLCNKGCYRNKKRSKNIYCLTPIYYKSVNATFCVRLYKII